ncbi:hypothetical protein JCM10450v2_005011 [Rhodotorula kratochvilovae]
MPPRAQAARTISDISVVHGAVSPVASTSGSSSRAGAPAAAKEEDGEPPPGRESEAGPAGKGSKKDKKSQRPSWSCTECTRRKIRCDRVVPGCNQCIKRNKVHLCRLDQDAETGFVPSGGMLPASSLSPSTGPPRLASATEYDAITRNVNVVRQRLYHLERVVRAFVPQPDTLDAQGNPMWGVDLNLLQTDAASAPGSTFPTPAQSDGLPLPPHPHAPAGGQLRDNEVEAAVSLEFLALGRDSKESHFSRAELRRPSTDDEDERGDALASPLRRPPHALPDDEADSPVRPAAAAAVDVLPDEATSTRLIDYSLDKCLWQHGGVHAGQFRRECAEFYSWGARRAEKVNQAWLALYYALLCVAVKHMTAEDAPAYGYSGEEQRTLAKTYFDASVEALHRANFLAKHQVYAVQTINIYAVSCQDVGESDLIATLLAAGIRIAQHLKMHLFCSDDEWDAKRRKNGIDPASEAGVKGLIEREIRKRVWYGLLTEDWISLHGRRAYAVSPTHFTTPLPLNCTDADLSTGVLVNRSQDEPTPASKTILLYRVADCLRRFFEHIHSSHQLDYAYCIEADRALRNIILDGPAFLKAEPAAAGEGYPEWTAWFRSYWVISISHKLLVVHRMFVAPAGQAQDDRQLYSRRVTIEAARSVIQQLARSPRASTQSYWTLPYHTMSAATTIMLDIFQSPADPDVPHKRLEVQHALHELQQLAPGSHIAQRGVALLGTLLAEEARVRAPAEETATAGAFDGVAKRASAGGGGGLSHISPSITSSTTPFFVPTAAGVPSLPAPPVLPAPGSAAAGSGALASAPLSQEALEALFAGFGGDSAFSRDGLASGDGASVGLDLSLGLGLGGGAGDDPAAVDFWRMLNAGGMEEFGGAGFGAGGEGDGMDGIEGAGAGEWAMWPQ